MRSLLPLLALVATLAAGCSADAPTAPAATPACAAGMASTDLTALAPYESQTVAGPSLSCVLLAGDARYVLMPQFTTTAMPYALYPYAIGLPGAPILPRAAVASLAVRPGPIPAAERLHDMLRAAETRLRPDARTRSAARARASRALAVPGPPSLGSARDFSVLSGLADPPAFARATATLRFAGASVLLYLDERAAGAYDVAEIDALGRQFDEVLYPVDRGAFGAESDTDGNGRVIVVLTPAVNALVRADECASFGYVTGYFFGLDLVSSAPESNRGEVFYAMTPDPEGRFSCAHSSAEVARALPPTFVHELQHMISYGRRVLVEQGEPEVPWLNEGLSHLAEELGARYYEAKYPAPAARTDPGQLFPDSASPMITGDLRNSYRFLSEPRQHSIATCAPATYCTTADRGGAWLFLRWLADQHGDAAIYALVQSSARDVRNVEQATGRPFAELFGDFALATWGDSIVGAPRASVDTRRRFASRNLRRLYRALYDAYGPLGGVPRAFPLEPLALRADERLKTSLRPGSFDVFTISTPQNVTRLPIAVTAESGEVLAPLLGAQLSIMRLP